MAKTHEMATRQILIADDDRMIRLVVVQVLTQFGHEVHEAEDGDEAVRICTEREIDLAILDYAMPGRSGLSAAEVLHRRDVPFLFLTASEDLEVMQAAVKEGALGYLLKPVGPRDLVAAVAAALERSGDAQALAQAIQRARDINIAIGLLMCQRGETRERAGKDFLKGCRSRGISARAAALELIEAFESTLTPAVP